MSQKIIENYLKENLNPQQFAAATHIKSSSLIIAGAGSGKTRTLTFKIAYLIFGHGINPGEILAVTFTNKAANEMKERLIELSKQLKKDLNLDIPILSNYNLKRIGTFHSIFLKILKESFKNDKNLNIIKDIFGEHKLNSNFSIVDIDDCKKIFKEAVKAVIKDEEQIKIFLNKVKVKELKIEYSKRKNEGKTPKDYLNTQGLNGETEFIKGKIFEKYQELLLKNNSLDFDDLLLFPFLIFKNNPEELLKRKNTFKYILVDEAQDTNRIQFELIKLISKGHKKFDDLFQKDQQNYNITLIGDDYQSIYGRRGAIMENFLNVKKIREDIEIFKLEINYRSASHIVEAGNFIIKNNLFQYKKEIQAYRQEKDKIYILKHKNPEEEAYNIAKLIQKLKEEKNISRNDVAILYRTNSQSKEFEEQFVQLGIPYKIIGGFKFFERAEIKDILAYLNIFINPHNNIFLERILNTPNRKIGKTTLNKLKEAALIKNISLRDLITNPFEIQEIKITSVAKKGIDNFLTSYNLLKQKLDNLKPYDFFSLLINEIKYKDYLKQEEGEKSEKFIERRGNIETLGNMATKFDIKGKEGLQQRLEEISLLTDFEQEDNINAIKLMTIHASKGLEFPVVFIVGAEEGLFPSYTNTLDSKKLEEERRLMYVGITRAKNHLFLSHCETRYHRGEQKICNPSRFINELPEELLNEINLSTGGGEKENTYYDFYEGQMVTNPLFGKGKIIEIRNSVAIVKFEKLAYPRKIKLSMLKPLSNYNF